MHIPNKPPGNGNIVPQDITIEYTCIAIDLQSNNIWILTYGELHILTDFFEKKKLNLHVISFGCKTWVATKLDFDLKEFQTIIELTKWTHWKLLNWIWIVGYKCVNEV